VTNLSVFGGYVQLLSPSLSPSDAWQGSQW